MADLSKIRLNGINYNLKDAVAREAIEAISEDAISALMVLGYSSKEATDSVRKVYQEGMSLEETVRLALKNI